MFLIRYIVPTPHYAIKCWVEIIILVFFFPNKFDIVKMRTERAKKEKHFCLSICSAMGYRLQLLV